MKTPQTALKAAASPALLSGPGLPPVIVQAGPKARIRFVEFFTAHIRNPNTRDAYARDIARFCAWCERHEVRLKKLRPVIIAAYIEELGRDVAAPSVKHHLAATRFAVPESLRTWPAAARLSGHR